MNSLNTNLTASIKELLNNARKQVVQTVNTTMVCTYFEIGKIIVEDEQKGKARAEYGKETLKHLSKELTKEFGKGFSVDNLQNMKKFYMVYSKSQTLSAKSEKSSTLSRKSEKYETLSSKSEKSSTLSRNSKNQQQLIEKPSQNNTTITKEYFTLSWSHYVFLIRLDEQERNFYEKETQINNWSLRELKRQFDSALYERVILSSDKKGVIEDNLQKYHSPQKPDELIKEPYILEFLGLDESNKYSETELEQKIIDHLEAFLLELGKGFTFVGRQKRFTFDEQHFFVDLVFYNRLLKCFVLIDLKLGKIKHQDVGQMQMYVNYYDRFVKTKEENLTIGILLSKDKNEALVEITLPENSNIFSKEYKLYLPTKEELKREIEKL